MLHLSKRASRISQTNRATLGVSHNQFQTAWGTHADVPTMKHPSESESSRISSAWNEDVFGHASSARIEVPILRVVSGSWKWDEDDKVGILT